MGKATLLDPILSKALELVMTGWPEECNQEDQKPYYTRRHESLVKRIAFCGAPG